MGEWDLMAEYVNRLDDGDESKFRVLGNTSATGDGSSNGTFFRAVLLVRRGKVWFLFLFLSLCNVQFFFYINCVLTNLDSFFSMMKHGNMLRGLENV